jgi:hypothetical protein
LRSWPSSKVRGGRSSADGFHLAIVDKSQVIEASLIRRKIVEDLLHPISRKYSIDACKVGRFHQFETIRWRPWKPVVHHLHAQRRQNADEIAVFCRGPQRLSVRLMSL